MHNLVFKRSTKILHTHSLNYTFSSVCSASLRINAERTGTFEDVFVFHFLFMFLTCGAELYFQEIIQSVLFPITTTSFLSSYSSPKWNHSNTTHHYQPTHQSSTYCFKKSATNKWSVVKEPVLSTWKPEIGAAIREYVALPDQWGAQPIR